MKMVQRYVIQTKKQYLLDYNLYLSMYVTVPIAYKQLGILEVPINEY